MDRARKMTSTAQLLYILGAPYIRATVVDEDDV